MLTARPAAWSHGHDLDRRIRGAVLDRVAEEVFEDELDVGRVRHSCRHVLVHFEVEAAMGVAGLDLFDRLAAATWMATGSSSITGCIEPGEEQ